MQCGCANRRRSDGGGLLWIVLVYSRRAVVCRAPLRAHVRAYLVRRGDASHGQATSETFPCHEGAQVSMETSSGDPDNVNTNGPRTCDEVRGSHWSQLLSQELWHSFGADPFWICIGSHLMGLSHICNALTQPIFLLVVSPSSHLARSGEFSDPCCERLLFVGFTVLSRVHSQSTNVRAASVELLRCRGSDNVDLGTVSITSKRRDLCTMV